MNDQQRDDQTELSPVCPVGGSYLTDVLWWSGTLASEYGAIWRLKLHSSVSRVWCSMPPFSCFPFMLESESADTSFYEPHQ